MTAPTGRPDPIPTDETHFVLGHALKGPHPEGFESAMFGMGCFWGVERVFWQAAGRLGDDGGLCRRVHARTRPTRKPAPN
jgi:hypothetical protein